MKKINSTSFCVTAAIALAAIAVSSPAHAQDVLFGAVQTITGDSNLLSSGGPSPTAGITNIDAALFFGPSQTVDGVTFNSTSNLAVFKTGTTFTDGVFTLTATSGGFETYGANATLPIGPGASAAFNTVMTSGGVFATVANTTTGTLTISAAALTLGATYEVQIFNRSAAQANESTIFTSANSAQVFDDQGGNNSANHIGEFVTGTFVATGLNEVITLSSGGGPDVPVLNDVNLVEINPATVPEPSTYALLLGGLALLTLQLRRQRHLSS